MYRWMAGALGTSLTAGVLIIFSALRDVSHLSVGVVLIKVLWGIILLCYFFYVLIEVLQRLLNQEEVEIVEIGESWQAPQNSSAAAMVTFTASR